MVDMSNQQLLQKQVAVQNDVFSRTKKLLKPKNWMDRKTQILQQILIPLLKGAQLNFEKKNFRYWSL